MEGDFYLIFTVGDRRFAMPCDCVVHVAAAAELLEVPNAPACARGVSNLGGEPVLVTDIRKRHGDLLPEMELSDRFVFFRRGDHTCGLLAESVEGVSILAPETVSSRSPSDGNGSGRDILVAYEPDREEGTIVLHPEDILSLTDAEFRSIDTAIPSAGESS